MSEHISGKEYQDEHNQGQKDVAKGTSDEADRMLTAFIAGSRAGERLKAYQEGREAAQRNIDRNKEKHHADRREEVEESGYSSGGSSSESAGAAGAAIILLPLLAVVGVFWLFYVIFEFIFRICGGYKITPVVSAQERLRVRFARARAEYEEIQKRLGRRRYTLAVIVLIVVAIPFAFVFGRVLYESTTMAIEKHRIESIVDTDKDTISIEQVRNRVNIYFGQNPAYSTHGSSLSNSIPT